MVKPHKAPAHGGTLNQSPADSLISEDGSDILGDQSRQSSQDRVLAKRELPGQGNLEVCR